MSKRKGNFIEFYLQLQYSYLLNEAIAVFLLLIMIKHFVN